MTATNETLAQAILRLRKATGLSLRQLQQQTGIDRSILSRLESGEKQRPSPTTLNRLAGSLRVPASELFTLAGYAANDAEALPAIRPYLRTKYGHLSKQAQSELATFLDRLEEEEGTKRAGGPKSK